MASIRQSFASFLAIGTITRAESDAALANLSTSRSVEDVCREADMLVESLPEEMEVKLEIFTIFDKFAKPGAVLATNTSAFPIADLAEITFRREECVGFRFVRPPSQATAQATPSSGPASIEIIRCAETSDATVAACEEVARRMGKRFIVFTEARG